MSNVVGKVEVVAPNKAAFYQVKIGNDWYGTGSKNVPSFKRGDTIDAEVVEKDIGGGRIVKDIKNVKIVADAAPARIGPESTLKVPGTAPVDWDLKDRKIQQQSARNAAIEFIGLMAKEGAIVYKTGATAAAKAVVLEALLVHYTDKFLTETGSVGKPEDAANDAADDLSGEES